MANTWFGFLWPFCSRKPNTAGNDCGIQDSKNSHTNSRKDNLKKTKRFACGRSRTAVVNMKLFSLSVNDDRFVFGKRRNLEYVLSGTEQYHNITTLAAQHKRGLLSSGNHPPFPLNLN